MSQLQVTGEAKIRDLQGPVVSNSGVISALDGDASQYVRGDGTLADFPTSTGGGSSVSYYLNSSVSQGTIGGVAYRQLGKTPIAGAGTDIVISSNGYVASYITDANDPALLEVPAGNFNCEFYFSVNNNTGNPFTYAEVYKYDGTTFTLIGTSVGVPEYINQGTVINPYYFAVPVAQSVLTVTDRIAIRIYVNVDGRTVTLHTENNHLCQVVTTFSKGLISLNNLTRQNQFFGTGTDGTDFNISSITATHTFNLPVASATNTGKLSSTDWSTFNGKVPYTGATGSVDLGVYSLSAGELNIEKNGANTSAINFEQATGTSILGAGYTSIGPIGTDGVTFFFGGATNSLTFKNNLLSASRSYSLPDLSGTLALLEGVQTFTGKKTFSNGVNITGDVILSGGTGYGGGIRYVQGIIQAYGSNETTTEFTDVNSIKYYVGQGSGNYKNFVFDVSNVTLNATRTYNLPDASGTIALTSDLSSYVTTGTTQTISGAKTFSGGATFTTAINVNRQINISKTPTLVSYTGGYITNYGTSNGIIYADGDTGNLTTFIYNFGGNYTYTFPAASGTIALTSDLSGYVTIATNQTITGAKIFTSAITNNQGYILKDLGPNSYLGVTAGFGGFSYNNTVAGFACYNFAESNGSVSTLNFPTSVSSKLYTFPDANGTIVLGSGTIGAVAYFTNNGSVVNGSSNHYWDNLNNRLGIVNSSPSYNLDVNGTGRFTGALIGTSATFGGLLTINVPTDNTTVGIFHAGGGTANRGLKISTFAATNDNAGVTLDAQTSTGVLAFATAGAEKMRITSGGNVGIGTSSPSFPNGAGLVVYASDFPRIQLKNSTTGDASTDGAGLFMVGTDYYISNRETGNMIFENGANSERMRITSGGYLKASNNGTYLNATGPYYELRQSANDEWIAILTNTSVSPYGPSVRFSTAPNNTSNWIYHSLDSSAERFKVASNGGIYNYQANNVNLSDINTKKEIIPLDSYWDKFKAIEIVKFKYKDQTHDDFNIGVIAQQVESVAPEFVDTDMWTLEDEQVERKAIYTSDLHHATIKVLQECMAKIEEQQAQIEELKAMIAAK
jgi:hypothetical protein